MNASPAARGGADGRLSARCVWGRQRSSATVRPTRCFSSVVAAPRAEEVVAPAADGKAAADVEMTKEKKEDGAEAPKAGDKKAEAKPEAKAEAKKN